MAPGDHASIPKVMAPKLADTDVLKIAALAHLALTPEEVALFGRQLTSILEYADVLQRVDTTGIAPTSHPFSAGPSWREDVPRPSLARDVVVAGGPGASVRTGLFKVPKVL